MTKDKKYNIVIFSMVGYFEWQKGWHGGLVNRNYFILQEFLKNDQVNKVLNIDFVLPKFRSHVKELIKASPYKKDLTTILKTPLSKTNKITEQLFVYSAYKNNLKKIEKTITKLGMNENLIIWSYDPFLYKIFQEKRFSGATKIFDAVDNWAKHPNYEKESYGLERNYNYIKENANIIFTVSDELRELFDNKENVHWLKNGADFDHWQNKLELPKDMKKIPRPIIGYHGILQERLDQDLLSFLANNNPDKSFVLVGWKWNRCDFSLLENYKNIHFLGHKSYDELPFYVNNFDVCLIPHKVDEFTKSMNPMKIYEYLSCGKPIISTNISGVGGFENTIYTAKTKEEFNDLLQKALKEKAPEKDLAKEHTWQKRVKEALEIIENIPLS